MSKTGASHLPGETETMITCSRMPTVVYDRDGPEEVRNEIFENMKNLPTASKGAYLQALQECPDLIQKESDPMRFMQREGITTEEAAQLLAKNWEMRVKFFGERAFRPLNLSGEGALNETDIVMLQSGCFAVLPNDAQGRPVVWFYVGRDQKEASMPEKRRARFACLFYILHRLAMEYKSFVIIRYAETFHLNGRNPGALSELFSPMPIEMDAYHGLFLPPPGAKQFVVKTILPILHTLFGDMTKRLHTEVIDHSDHAAETLEKCGISKDTIPVCKGGSSSVDNFMLWIERNRLVEIDLKKSSLPSRKHGQPKVKATSSSKLTSEANDMEGKDSPTSSVLDVLAVAANAALMKERKARKRKMDVIYARQRRQREKCEEESLTKEHAKLVLQNEALKEEGRKLQSLMEVAKATVRSFADLPEKQQNASKKPSPGKHQRLLKSKKSTHPSSPKARSLPPKKKRVVELSALPQNPMRESSALHKSSTDFRTAVPAASCPKETSHLDVPIEGSAKPKKSLGQPKDDNFYLEQQSTDGPRAAPVLSTDSHCHNLGSMTTIPAFIQRRETGLPTDGHLSNALTSQAHPSSSNELDLAMQSIREQEASRELAFLFALRSTGQDPMNMHLSGLESRRQLDLLSGIARPSFEPSAAQQHLGILSALRNNGAGLGLPASTQLNSASVIGHQRQASLVNNSSIYAQAPQAHRLHAIQSGDSEIAGTSDSLRTRLAGERQKPLFQSAMSDLSFPPSHRSEPSLLEQIALGRTRQDLPLHDAAYMEQLRSMAEVHKAISVGAALRNMSGTTSSTSSSLQNILAPTHATAMQQQQIGIADEVLRSLSRDQLLALFQSFNKR